MVSARHICCFSGWYDRVKPTSALLSKAEAMPLILAQALHISSIFHLPAVSRHVVGTSREVRIVRKIYSEKPVLSNGLAE